MLISCLMITKDRLDRVRRSIGDFCQQDYPARELVIVTDGSHAFVSAIKEMIADLGRRDIRIERIEGERTLGSLRNISVDVADGDLVCQWDDDDRYHPTRLTRQAQLLRENQADACFVGEQMHYFEDTGELYWCDWTRWRPWASLPIRLPAFWRWRTTPTAPRNSVVPGSLLALKSSMPRYDEGLRRYEDALVKDAFYDRGLRVVALKGAPEVITYTYHGHNTYDREHHLKFVRHCGVSRRRMCASIERLVTALEAYAFSQDVSLCANSGRVFHVLAASGVTGGPAIERADRSRENTPRILAQIACEPR